MKDRRTRHKVIKYLSCMLVFVLFALVVLLGISIQKANEISDDLNSIEYLNAGSQRLTKLVISGYPQGDSLSYLDMGFHYLLSSGNEYSINALNTEVGKETAQQILEGWDLLKKSILSEELNATDLHLGSEQLFYQIAVLMKETEALASEVEEEILTIQLILLVIAITMMLLVLQYMLTIRTDMKFHALRTRMASIDAATGLLNRSSCQDLIETAKAKEGKVSAMIVFDLNDLKKANDTQGHQLGDSLIFTFAYALREASQIHKESPFIGRYGGDEFIVYYEGIDSKEEVVAFLDKLREIVDDLNGKESRFQVSFAVGYAINEKGNPLTTKQLFDEADEIMYHHKIISKENKAFSEESGEENGKPPEKENELESIYQKHLEEHSLAVQTQKLAKKENRKNRNILIACCSVACLSLLLSGTYHQTQQDYIGGNVLYLPNSSSLPPDEQEISSPWRVNSTSNMLLYANLFSTDATLNEVNPALASSWKEFDGGYTYEITLKNDLYWSDGHPLTMDDVVFSIESVVLCSNYNTYLSYGLNEIVGVEQWKDGSADSISGLSVEGNVLTIKLENRYNNFLLMLTQFAPLPKHTWEDVDPTTLTSDIPFSTDIVSSGLFKVGGATEDGNIYFIPNSYFHGESPQIEEVVLVANYQPTDIDFYYTNVITEMVDYRALDGYTEYDAKVHFYRYFIYNIAGEEGSEEENPIADLKVRQALVHALNREDLLKEVYFNQGYNIYAGTLSEASSSAYVYDPQRARELLEEAEYDFDRPLRVMYYYTDTVSLLFLEKVKEYYEEIGLQVELLQITSNQNMNEIRDYDIMLKGLSAFDSTDWYYEYLPSSTYLDKVFGTDNPFEDMVEELVSTPITETEKISQIKQELIRLEQSNLYKMPLFTLNQNTYVNTNRVIVPDSEGVGNAWHRYDIKFEQWEIKKG